MDLSQHAEVGLTGVIYRSAGILEIPLEIG